MREKLHHPATIIAVVALVIALGGAGYAVTALPRNSVGTAQLKNNAVTAQKVKDGTLQAADFAPGQLPRGAQGERGLQGAQGERGITGPTGPAGADAVTSVRGVRMGAGETLLANGESAGLISIADDGKGAVVITTPTRVSGQMTVGMYKLGDHAARTARVACQTLIRDTLAPSEEPTQLTLPVYERFGTGSSLDAIDGFIASTGSVVLQPGSYNIAVECVNYGLTYGTGTVIAYGGTLTMMTSVA